MEGDDRKLHPIRPHEPMSARLPLNRHETCAK